MPSKMTSRQPRTVYLLKRAETVIRNGLETSLQPLAITPRQYVTLSLLHEQSDQSSAELARKAGITPQSMSETIATLTTKGLIERLEHPDHRRILMTRLTEAGEAALLRSEAIVDALEARLLHAIAADDLDTLRRALRIIARTADAASNDAGARPTDV